MNPLRASVRAACRSRLARPPVVLAHSSSSRRRPGYASGPGTDSIGPAGSPLLLGKEYRSLWTTPITGAGARPPYLCRRTPSGIQGRRTADQVAPAGGGGRAGVLLPLGGQGSLRRVAARAPRAPWPAAWFGTRPAPPFPPHHWWSTACSPPRASSTGKTRLVVLPRDGLG